MISASTDEDWELANEALKNYDTPPSAKVELLNVSENKTYKISFDNEPKFVIRLHREGYHSRAEIQSELTWIQSINGSTTVSVPLPILNRKDELITTIQTPSSNHRRFAVAFNFVEGVELEEDDSADHFETLGSIAAQLHNQVIAWEPPRGFRRFSWRLKDAFGTNPRWGAWSKGVDKEKYPYLKEAVDNVSRDLHRYGVSSKVFGLVHADMRLSNVIWVKESYSPTLIDFDDCGYSWYLYDLATAISFFEHKDIVPELIGRWIVGYERIRKLDNADKEAIWPLVLFRRFLLLGWMQTHPEVEICKRLQGEYLDGTLHLAIRYLEHKLPSFSRSVRYP